MYQYNTSIPVRPALSEDKRLAALDGLSQASPVQAPGPHADVYAGLASGNRVNFDRAAEMANQNQMLNAQETQGQMALRGIQQLSQQRQNAQNLGTQRLQTQMGFLNSLLSGLYT
jgi:hypothetical protein